MAVARVLTLIDALISEIRTAWGPSEPDTISREYIGPVNDQELENLIGRHIYAFPGRYDNSPDTRGHDDWVHEVSFIIIERFTDTGDAALNSWMDDRIDFVQTKVVNSIDFDRTKLAIGSTRNVMTTALDIDVYDLDLLNRLKIFRSQVDAVFTDRDVG